ncbi:hypothetical protein MTR67_018819 [Solanum verrucosum]|uniref:Retrotransposon Copia-like N-terminal domain-containing protein n=1 Tax=Solanum verrucosum TaxID=315347 RepID=A0AAF0TN03_SOLVR|nr:hypothetical protein MTR67_018819 [Solanum verrucosum]
MAETHRRRRKSPTSTFQLAIIVFLVSLVNLQFSSVKFVWSQSIVNGAGTASQLDNPAVLDLVTRTVYNRIYNLTLGLFDNQFSDKFKFCILNRDEEWNHAFNYSSNLAFLSACVTRTKELFFSSQSSKFLITHPPPMAPSVTNSDATNTTTIVQFNSVTQLPIKLAGSHNFSLWKAQVSMLMRGHNLYGHLDGTIPAPAETTTTNNLTISNPDYVNWFRQDQLIQNAILASVDPTLAAIVAAATTAKAAWDSLHTAYANKSQTRIFSLRDRLARLTKESQPVTDYLNQVRSLCDELATAGAPVTNAELIIKTLTGLGPEYREISAAIRARDTPISYAELFEKLSDHELFLKHNAPPQSTPITAAVAQKSSSQTRTNAINNNRCSNNYQQRSQSGRNAQMHAGTFLCHIF